MVELLTTSIAPTCQTPLSSMRTLLFSSNFQSTSLIGNSTESDGWDSVSEPSQSSHRDHKPDLCFGFPIYNTEGRKIEGFRNSPLFPFLKNFTSDLLSELAKKGLRCTPVSSSHTKMAETKENRAGLQSLTICFPWCIMQQVARAEDSEDLEFEMFRRVSVAASPALSMFERLARFADERQDGQHIQPVITFTSVGSNVTLALAYSEIVDDKYTDHVRADFYLLRGRIDNSIEDIECLGRLHLQDLGRHSVLPYPRQHVILGEACSVARGLSLHRSMETPLLS
jgi:hypothetical protein